MKTNGIFRWLSFCLGWFCLCARSQTLDLPARQTNAISGSAFAQSLIPLDRDTRETKIIEQVVQGNVPDFLRKLSPIHVEAIINGVTNSAVYFVTPDYLAIGSDADYFLTPLSPIAAQKVADLTHCSLPTRKMADDIYQAAAVKLSPSPIPPTAVMATVPIFIEHDGIVKKQRAEQLPQYPLGTLVAGDKKDVVISAQLANRPGKVAIYGWHKPDGKAIQPLYLGHADYYADYSHGIRFVQSAMTVNGAAKTVAGVLSYATLAPLLSDEGTFSITKYPENFHHQAAPTNVTTSRTVAGALNNNLLYYSMEPEVNIAMDSPRAFALGKKMQLIFYALPNGATIEQTIGHTLKPGEDWRFDIQNIGAQTRFLRERFTNETLVVVYLQAAQKSWPAWRKLHADRPKLIPQIIDSIKARFAGFELHVTLSSHSGGGSFIFGYLNAMDAIPRDIDRIAFLDSNYGYDQKLGHDLKLLKWLTDSTNRYLCTLAYDDAIALLDGKHFVSANGGTWGRSHAMLNDFGEQLKFQSTTNNGLETYTALDGRMKFLLRENPEKKIFHTVQVERNGFIECMLSGTTWEGKDYVYFGERAYTNVPASP